MSAKNKKSSAFNTMATLSYVGNGLWALLFIILLIGCVTNGTSIANSGGMSELVGGVVGVMAAMSLIVIIMCFLCIRGVAKMKKGDRSGFMLYLIGNGLWIALLIYGGRTGSIPFLAGALISTGFTGFYAMKLPKMG